MKMISAAQIREFIKDSLRDQNNFPREFAYLCVTSKPEHVIRDLVAARLHSVFGDELLIAREWPYQGRRRIDLAILDSDIKPLGLIELKTLIAADADEKYNSEEICHDNLNGLCKQLSQITTAPAIGVATYVELKTCEGKLSDSKIRSAVIKYASDHKGFAERRRSENLLTHVEKHLRGSKKLYTDSFEVPIGEAWGNEVTLHHVIVWNEASK